MFKVDKLGYYKTRGGDVVEVESLNHGGITSWRWPIGFKHPTHGNRTCTENGIVMADFSQTKFDLVEYIGETLPIKQTKQERITALEKRVAELEAIIAEPVKVEVQLAPDTPQNPVFITKSEDEGVWYVEQGGYGEWRSFLESGESGAGICQPGFRTKEAAEEWAEYNRVCLLLRAQEGCVGINGGLPRVYGEYDGYHIIMAIYQNAMQRDNAIEAVGGQSVIDNAARIFMGLPKNEA